MDEKDKKIEELYYKMCDKLEYGLSQYEQGVYDIVDWLVNNPDDDAPEI